MPSPPIAQTGPSGHNKQSKGDNQNASEICDHGSFSYFVEHLPAGGDTDQGPGILSVRATTIKLSYDLRDADD